MSLGNGIDAAQQEERMVIIRKIVKPSLKYFFKKVNSEVFNKNQKAEINTLAGIVTDCLVNIDINILAWVQDVFKKNTGEDMEAKIKMIYLKALKENLKIGETKNE